MIPELQIVFFTCLGYVFGAMAGFLIGRKYKDD